MGKFDILNFIITFRTVELKTLDILEKFLKRVVDANEEFSGDELSKIVQAACDLNYKNIHYYE